MLTIIAAAMVQAAGPAPSVECGVTGRREGRFLVDIGLACPGVDVDQEGLVQAAAGVIDRLDERYDLRALEPTRVNNTLEFVHDGRSWALPEPAAFFSVAPSYPPRAAEAGYDGRCDLALTLDARGRPADIEVACAQFRNINRARESRLFENKAREAAERFVYFTPEPGTVPPCAQTHFDFVLRGDPLGRPVENAPQCPGG